MQPSVDISLAQAAVVIAIDFRTDLILGICDMDGLVLGFPGGKREANESTKRCAQRELREETQLVVSLLDLHPIFAMNDGGYYCAAFWCLADHKKILVPEPKYTLRWLAPAEFTSGEKVRFPVYNRTLLERFDPVGRIVRPTR